MRRLGEILLERGFATVGELHTALEACHRHRSRLGTQLLRLGFVSEKQLLEALSEQVGRPPVPQEMISQTSSEIRAILPLKVAERLRAVPFARVHRQLQVGFTNPRDEAAIEEIQSLTGLAVEAFVATESSLAVALEALAREAAGEDVLGPQEVDHIAAKGWDGLWSPELPAPDFLLSLGETEDPEPSRAAIFATYPALSPVLDPNSVQGAGYLDEAGLERALSAAENRDQVGEALLAYATRYLSRLCLFSIFKDRVRGWLVTGLGPVLEDVQSFSVGIDTPSIFKALAGGASHHQGPAPQDDTNSAIAGCLGDPPPQDLVAFPIWLQDRAVGFLVGDIPGQSTVVVPIDELKRASDVAGVALEMMILRRKIGRALSRPALQGTK